MNISDVARKTGLSGKAIRFYEQKGIISPPQRSANGYRTYVNHHIEELTLLRQARQVGFSLEECRELVAMFNDPQRHSADIKQRTLQKVRDLDRQMEELTRMRQRLVALAESCPGDQGAACPIIDSLAGCCAAQTRPQDDQ